MEARVAALCRSHGLSHAALNALAVVEGRGEPSTPGDVAAAMHMTSGSMTSLVDTLVRNGWARRSADDDDRRKVRIEITPAGEALLDEVLPRIQSLAGALLHGLSQSQQRTLLDLLEKASDSMAAFDGEPPPAAPRNKRRR